MVIAARELLGCAIVLAAVCVALCGLTACTSPGRQHVESCVSVLPDRGSGEEVASAAGGPWPAGVDGRAIARWPHHARLVARLDEASAILEERVDQPWLAEAALGAWLLELGPGDRALPGAVDRIERALTAHELLDVDSGSFAADVGPAMARSHLRLETVLHEIERRDRAAATVIAERLAGWLDGDRR